MMIRCAKVSKRSFFSVLIFIVMMAGNSGVVFSQQLSPSVMPLDAKVDPPVAVFGNRVKIAGSAVPYNRNKTVTVSIVKPGREKTILNTELDRDNYFSLEFSDTIQNGVYNVLVRGPGNQGEKNLSFKVQSPAAQRALINSRLKKNTESINLSIRDLTEKAKNAPASPAQVEYHEKLQELQGSMQSLQRSSENIQSSFEELEKISNQFPELAVHFSPVYSSFDEVLFQSENLQRELESSTRGTDGHRNLCDGLYYSAQALKTAGLLLNMAGGAFKTAESVVVGLQSDNLASNLPAEKRTASNKFLIGQGLNRSLDFIKDSELSLDKVGGLIGDLIPFAVDQVFEVYCEKFTGPVQASIEVQVKENGRMWWKYSTKIDAAINVRYEKGSASSSIPVSGEIEGVGSRFTVWEDFTVLDPRVRKDVLVKFAFPPVPGSLQAVSIAGLGGVATPQYFRIPVKGEIAGSSLKLLLQPATVDFKTSAKAKIAYILLNPGMPIPHVLTTDLPYQGAHFIITRVLGGSADFIIKVDRSGKISQIEKNANRDAQMNGGNINIKLNAALKACNPECP